MSPRSHAARHLWLVAVAVLVLALPVAVAGCGGDGGEDADPAAGVPADASLYVEVTVRPEGDLREDTEAALRRILRTEDPAARIRDLVDREVLDEGDTYEGDVEPWLGRRIGIFFARGQGEEPPAAAIAATSDPDEAERGLREDGDRESEYEGETLVHDEPDGDEDEEAVGAVVEDYAIVGTEAGVRAAIDVLKGADALAEAEGFEQALEPLDDEDEALARAYVDPDGLTDALAGVIPAEERTALRQVLDQVGAGLGATFAVEGNALRLDVATRTEDEADGEQEPDASMLEELPGDAWLAFATGDIERQVTGRIEQLGRVAGLAGLDEMVRDVEQETGVNLRRDLLSWMGQGSGFVRGRGPEDIGGGLVVASKDPEATRRAIPRIARVVEAVAEGQVQASELEEEGVDEGLRLRAEGIPVPINIAAAGERFVLAVGDPGLRAALDPEQPLSDNEDFGAARESLQGDVQPSLFLDVAPVLRLLDDLGVTEDAEGRRARETLAEFRSVVGGSSRDGDNGRTQIVANLR
jgi:hypothetical protein